MPRKTGLAVPKRQAVTTKPARKRPPRRDDWRRSCNCSKGCRQRRAWRSCSCSILSLSMIVACRLAGKGRAGGGVVLMCAVLMCAVLMCAVLMRAVLMTVASGRLVLASRRNSMLLIDCFLRSLAANRGEVAMGVILSGTGADGTAGVEAVNTGVASPSRVSEGRSCS
jgi:hypothetical protein